VTIRDMIEDGVVIQGDIIIRHWDEELEENVTHVKEDVMDGIYSDIDDAVLDAELKYMFIENGYLTFEIEAPEKELDR